MGYSFRSSGASGFCVTIVAIAALCSLCIGCRDEPASTARTPTPARSGLDKTGKMHLSEGDRCPVCAMPVTAHKKFAGAIALLDGRTYYFCGTGCLIRSWLHPEVFLGTERDALDKAVVKEYFAGEHVDARSVIFVAGSDVVGPMGPALVPLKSEADVTTFKRRHGGKTSFRLDEMNDERWKAVTGKNVTGGKTR